MKYYTSRLSFCVLISGVISILFTACGSDEAGIKPEVKDIVESVYASASIKAAGQYTLYAPVSGILLRNAVREGDSVHTGQIIAAIDNANPAMAQQNARLALDLAQKNQGNLKELEAQLRTAAEQKSLDSINYIRQQELWQKNIGTKTQLETRKLAAEASANNWKVLKIRYAQSKIQIAAGIEQAQNNYNIASKNSGDFSISSNMNGRVYALNYEPGELVTPQKPVALIGRSGQFILELTVDEVDISRVVLGQKLLIAMDAYRDNVFEGKVSRIYPNLDARSQSFIVEGEFNKGPETLYPGMSAEVNIVVKEKKKVLVIPVSYLQENGTVMTANGEVKVKTGLKNLEYVEIISGIDQNTEIIRP